MEEFQRLSINLQDQKSKPEPVGFDSLGWLGSMHSSYVMRAAYPNHPYSAVLKTIYLLIGVI